MDRLTRRLGRATLAMAILYSLSAVADGVLIWRLLWPS